MFFHSDFNQSLYELYYNIFFYENCIDSMQTVSLVENIISYAKHLYIQECSNENTVLGSYSGKYYNFARDAVCVFLQEQFVSSDIIDTATFTNLISLLKQYARSASVKNYFGI